MKLSCITFVKSGLINIGLFVMEKVDLPNYYCIQTCVYLKLFFSIRLQL
jgi:hypothetical protein